MHKVKGLEFDAVIIPPSFSNLPINKRPNNSRRTCRTIRRRKAISICSIYKSKVLHTNLEHHREIALVGYSINDYAIPENLNSGLGIPVVPEIKKLNIGWAASEYIFKKTNCFDYIKSNIKSGDLVEIKKLRRVKKDGTEFLCMNYLRRIRHLNRTVIQGSWENFTSQSCEKFDS